ncbi:MAG: type II toxin-antitoxin system RelE/ParE family toxin [bacterium]
MSDEASKSTSVEYTPEFKRNLRHLAKKYLQIRSDVQPIIDALCKGEAVGDRIQGTAYTVFKVRIRNGDIRKGKRSGYRLIYYLKSPNQIILVTIYSKLDQGDVSADQIRRILTETHGR